jgi:hypothetical protein
MEMGQPGLVNRISIIALLDELNKLLQHTQGISFLKPCPLCLRKEISDAEEPSYRIVTATLIEKNSKVSNTN